jgi:hypothetical protein
MEPAQWRELDKDQRLRERRAGRSSKVSGVFFLNIHWIFEIHGHQQNITESFNLTTWNEDPRPSHMFFSYVSLFQLIASNTSM